MSAVGDVFSAPAATARPLAAWRSNALWLVAITVLAVIWQTRWGTVPDTSWLITVCERVLAGERLYVDLYETNPPFSIWLYMPPVALAQALGVASEYLVHAWTYLLAVAGFLLACHVASRAGFPENAELARLAPAFYALLVLFPGIAFSEREHIGAALFLPLLVLMAWRARADASTRPGLGLALTIGLCASVLLLVKPHYAVTVLAPALFVCWRSRSIRPIFAAEHWVIGIVCVAYLAAVFLLYPVFIREIFPRVADVYMQIRAYLHIIAAFCLPMAVLMFLIWRLWPMDRVPEPASVATLAALSGLLPLIVQGKGWAYHAYPAMLYAICALLCLLVLPSKHRRSAGWMGGYPLLMKPRESILLIGFLIGFASFWPSQKPDSGMVAAIREATYRPTIALIGSDLGNGHPLTRIVEGHWAETYVSDWLGRSAVELALEATWKGDSAKAARYRSILDHYANGKRDELLARRPDIILVQKDEEPWLDLLRDRYGFGQVLSSYALLWQDEDLQVYLRNGYRSQSETASAR